MAEQESVKLFGRQYNLQINTANKIIDLSNLHAVFNTTAWVSGTPKTLRIRVFNFSPQTILPVQNEGGQIILSAGYDGQFGIIFSGQIIQVWTGRENATDTFCDIIATDGDKFYTQGFISSTLDSSQTSLSNRMFHIVSNTQIEEQMFLDKDNIIIDTSTSTNNTLPRGRVYFGMSKDHLRQVTKSVGALYQIENNNEVHILGIDRTKQKAAYQINYKTGLIGVPTQTTEGISFKMLLNPYIVQGQMIQLNSDAIQMKEVQVNKGGAVPDVDQTRIQQKSTDGFYKVLYCNHSGDTRGTNWYTDIVCYTKIIKPEQAQYGDYRVEQV